MSSVMDTHSFLVAQTGGHSVQHTVLLISLFLTSSGAGAVYGLVVAAA